MIKYNMKIRFLFNEILIEIKKYKKNFKHIISYMANYVFFLYILRNRVFPIRCNSRKGDRVHLSPL